MNLQRMIELFMEYYLNKQFRPKTIQSDEQALKLLRAGWKMKMYASPEEYGQGVFLGIP